MTNIKTKQNMAASKRSPGQPAGQQTLNFARASTAAEAAAKMFGNSGAKKKQKKAKHRLAKVILARLHELLIMQKNLE